MWKVFAADDEGYIREALKKLIDWEKMNCKLEEVFNDGQELADRMKIEQPDIVITDIKMPGMDGLDVCKFINENYPDIQVIILTAHSDFENARKAIKYNVCEYILKISIVDELPVAIEKAIQKAESFKRTKESSVLGDNVTLLEQIDHYIAQNYKNHISLEDISDALHMNGSYLSRFYKNKTGINLFDAILNCRIEAAKEYLKKTDRKAYEISELVGFKDEGYFSKMFKKITGLSPKDYRKKGTKIEK